MHGSKEAFLLSTQLLWRSTRLQTSSSHPKGSFWEFSRLLRGTSPLQVQKEASVFALNLLGVCLMQDAQG